MELNEQVELIFKYLYENKETYVSVYEIVESLNQKINRRDVERILDDSRFLICLDYKFAMIEGYETDSKLYSLNLYGIEICDQAWKKNDEGVQKQAEMPYHRIFLNIKTYNLFENLKLDVRDKYLLADYSFIFRRMQKDKFIHEFVSDSEYRGFLKTKYNIDIEKTKLLDYCKTDEKERNYINKKIQMQLH